MKTFIQKGETVTLVAPYDVVSGAGLLVGVVFGVANYDALSGTSVEATTVGIISGLAKTTGTAWTAWTTLLYWDASGKKFTTTSNSGANKLFGVAAADAASGDATGTVRLNGTCLS